MKLLLLDIPLQTIVISLAGMIYTILMTLIGYLIVRSVKQFDIKSNSHEERLVLHHGKISELSATMEAHGIRLEKHSEMLELMMKKMSTMEAVSVEQNKSIMAKLEYITHKIDSYDENIRDFYQKYDLPLKK
jgi:uncharacterized coiled-coil protein SlyX